MKRQDLKFMINFMQLSKFSFRILEDRKDRTNREQNKTAI